jgi:hypothetical protein
LKIKNDYYEGYKLALYRSTGDKIIDIDNALFSDNYTYSICDNIANGEYYFRASNAINPNIYSNSPKIIISNMHDNPTNNIAGETSNNAISVYPNPILKNGTLYFSCKTSGFITDITGREFRVFTDQNNVNLQGFEKGIYLVKFNNGEKHKIIIH